MRPKHLPPTTQLEIDYLFEKHADWVKWANSKRDSLTLGFIQLATEELPWSEVEGLIFGEDCDNSPDYLAQFTREDLVDLYVAMQQRE